MVVGMELIDLATNSPHGSRIMEIFKLRFFVEDVGNIWDKFSMPCVH